MKTLAPIEPKPLKAFRDKYLAVVMMVAALFICFFASAQSDSLKYAPHNGFGDRYKRTSSDSVDLIPLSSSPHVPYRMGAIRYHPGDSTLQLWTGYQWNSIVTGGDGIDTAYAYDDSTIAIETPNQVYFVTIKGQNISNTSLTANGDYIQNWNHHWFFLDSLKALDFNSNRPDPNYPGNKKVFRFYSDSTSDATALQLSWGLKDVSNSTTDSVHGEISSNLVSTSITHWGHGSARYAEIDIRGNVIDPTIDFVASSETKASTIILGSTTYINPNDSLRIKAVPATTATKMLAIRDMTGDVGTVVAMDIPAGGSATLSNIGSGFRWVKTPSGQIKTSFAGYGIIKDSSSNTDGITDAVDTSSTNHLVTQSDLNDSASVLRAAIATGGSGEANTVTNVGSGAGLAKAKVGVDIPLKSLTSDATITVTGNTNDVNVKADTGYLKAVYLPLHLPGAKTINQAGNNITFAGGGKVRSDSLSLKKTIRPFMTADSSYGVGHSIMDGSAASVDDSTFFTRVARYHSLFGRNLGVPGSILYDAVKIQLAWINPGHNSYGMYMGSLNDVRVNDILDAANRPTINYIINGVKAMWMNHMAKIVISASDGGLTRSGSWSTNWDATQEGGKVTNGAYTSTAGDYIEYTAIDSSFGVQLMGTATAGATSVTVTIDGSPVETFSLINQVDGASGHVFEVVPKFYTGLSNATHTIRVTNNSGGYMVVDYFTRLRDAATAPPVCFFHEPYLDATGYGGGPASDAAIDTINVKYDSLRNSLPAPWKVRTIVARTNTRYIATTSSGLSGDHVHPNDLGHGQIAKTESDAVSTFIGADSGTIQYGETGKLYVDAREIAFKNDVTLQDVVNNNSVLNAPADIRGSILEFNGFSKLGFNFFKILGNSSAYAHGTLGVQGPLGGLFVGDRNGSDTTNGFQFYTGSAIMRIWQSWSGVDLIKIDSGHQTLFVNSTANNVLSNPTATVHIGGNDLGAAGHAPLKIGKSIWVGTPEAYAWEVDSLYIGWTNGAGTRDTLATRGWARANLGASSGITSINSQTGATQTISAGTGISVNSASNDHEISINSSYISAGAWTPTLTDGTNSSGVTPDGARYMRIGSVVTFSLRFVTTTSSGASATNISVTLPPGVTSNFTNGNQAVGTNSGLTGNVVADPSGDLLIINWISGTGGSETIMVTGQYTIL